MKMSKFKVGDIVRYVKEGQSDRDITLGNEYRVIQLHKNGLDLFVLDDSDCSQGFYSNQFELVEDEVTISDGDVVKKDGKEYVVRLEERERAIDVFLFEDQDLSTTPFRYNFKGCQLIGIEINGLFRNKIEPYVEDEVIKFRWKK